MNKSYSVHWTLGIACVIVAFWGNYLMIPAQYVTAAGALIPGILAHAMAFVPDVPAPVAPVTPDDLVKSLLASQPTKE